MGRMPSTQITRNWKNLLKKKPKTRLKKLMHRLRRNRVRRRSSLRISISSSTGRPREEEGEETTEADVAAEEVATEEEGASTETATREGSTEGEASRGTRRR